jgi:hypothetical protein
MKEDMLKSMFESQKEFMDLLREKRGFPEFPVDLSTKDGQRHAKHIAYDAMGEMFEAIATLSNSKSHRATDVGSQFDRDHYLEEIVDATHYLLELVILSGFTPQEFFDAYTKKGEVNVTRIKSGY